MYYKISSITPQQVRLDMSSLFPERIHAFVFENDRGVVRVIGNKEETDVAFIPYSDIDYFEVKSHSSGGQSSSTFYDVVMNLKNLSSWYLIEFGHRNQAEQELRRLKASLTLGTPPVSYQSELPTKRVSITKSSDKIVLRWSNPVNAKLIMRFVVISLIIAAAMVGFYLLIRDSKSFLAYLVWFLFAFFLGAALINRIKQLLTDSSSTYGFSISPREVEYFEETKDGRNKRKSLTVAMNNWFGLSYSAVTRGEGQEIMMLNKSQAQHYADRKRAGESFAQLKKAIAGMEVVQHLRISELHPLHKLALVNWVNDEINKSRQDG